MPGHPLRFVFCGAMTHAYEQTLPAQGETESASVEIFGIMCFARPSITRTLHIQQKKKKKKRNLVLSLENEVMRPLKINTYLVSLFLFYVHFRTICVWLSLRDPSRTHFNTNPISGKCCSSL